MTLLSVLDSVGPSAVFCTEGNRPPVLPGLVVSLPASHEGGALVVTHDGESRRIELGGGDARFQVRYAAFYADCQHEVLPVRRGYRICLVYNLSIARKRQPVAPRSTAAVVRQRGSSGVSSKTPRATRWRSP